MIVNFSSNSLEMMGNDEASRKAGASEAQKAQADQK
jgi:hypothetical protein